MQKNTPYRFSYRFTSTLISAIVQRNHHYLVTHSSDFSETLMKIYADKDLSIEVAVFKLFKPDHNWILERQSKVTVKTTITYEPEEGA